MCEINPKHSAFFRLEAFTSHTMTEEEFQREVATKLVEVENKLNEDGRFRFHIHEGGREEEDPFADIEPTDEQVDQMRSDDLAIATRYAVICVLHGRVYMTKEEYDRQMRNPNAKWHCPQCGSRATFDDETYDEHE